jgi:hypothetical protein
MALTRDVLTITIDRERDPDGSKLDALVTAWLTYERARRTRQSWLCAAAAAGVLVALRAHWMPLFTPQAGGLALASSATVGLCAGLAGVTEWWQYRRWTRRLSENRR